VHVGLAEGRRIPDDDAARIDVAVFTGDVWTSGLERPFFGVVLGAPNVRWLHTFSAGTDAPAFQWLRDRGVTVTSSAGASSRPIAHSVMMYVLSLCRTARHWSIDQSAHVWRQHSHPDVEGRTMGIVGLGHIGSEVARLAPHFGMRVIGVRRTPRGDEPCETWPTERLHELLPLLDDLVITAPLTPETEKMIGERELALLRPGAHVVNVGRGPIVDEAALVAALQDGRVGAAALDVFEVEPLPADSPLWDMPNVIVSPHNSGQTPLAVQRTVEIFTAHLAHFAAGEPLLDT